MTLAAPRILQESSAGPVVVRPRWCAECRRTVQVQVHMLLPRPSDPQGRARYDDALSREIDAAFWNEHVPTHDAAALTSESRA